MTKSSQRFLLDLLSTPSPTGWEARGQQIWAAYVRQSAQRVESDAYGNAWATLDGSEPSAPCIMLEAHADEIGFIIKYVMDDGYLRLSRVGGVDHATARGRRLTVLGDRGPVQGVIGNTAIHIRDLKNGEKAPEVHELYVDVGASNPQEVAQMGLRVGHPAVYTETAQLFGKNRITGRALDNRIGGFIIAEVIRRLARSETPPVATVHAANCVHEEIGGLGSMMVAHRLNPDVCVVLDVTHATDTPGIKFEKHGEVTLGKGPTLTHGAANHPLVVRRLMEVAEKHQISVQHEAASRYTGTDADKIYPVREGIPTALVSLPLRYMHSVVEMADFGDVDLTIRLLTRFVRSVKTKDSFFIPV